MDEALRDTVAVNDFTHGMKTRAVRGNLELELASSGLSRLEDFFSSEIISFMFLLFNTEKVPSDGQEARHSGNLPAYHTRVHARMCVCVCKALSWRPLTQEVVDGSWEEWPDALKLVCTPV